MRKGGSKRLSQGVFPPRSVPFWPPALQLQLQPEKEGQVPVLDKACPPQCARPEGLGWAGEPPHFRQPSPHTRQCWLCGMTGSCGVAISLRSEAAHLFPGIGRPAPTHPQSGNPLALGLWEKGTAWFPPCRGGRGCHCCNNPFQVPGLPLLRV